MKKELIYSKLEKVSSPANNNASRRGKGSLGGMSDCCSDYQTTLDDADEQMSTVQVSGSTPNKKRSKAYLLLTKVELQVETIIREKMATVSMLFPPTQEELLPPVVRGEPLSNRKLGNSKQTFVELNSYELQCIDEVRNAANEASFYDKTKFPVIGEVPNLLYALNLSELYIRKMIKLCKNISGKCEKKVFKK